MKLMDIITENHRFEYGCVMLDFDFPIMNKIHDAIDPNDIYTEGDDYGVETEPHITILFGLHNDIPDADIINVVKNTAFGDCRIHSPSLFSVDEHEVLKYEVSYADRGGAFLHKLNQELKKFPYTSEFPNYEPHMTIAYLKKGCGQRYVKMLQGSNFILKPKNARYSKANKTQIKIPIQVR